MMVPVPVGTGRMFIRQDQPLFREPGEIQ